MANKNKPAFVSFIKVKHTGLSPYKANLGMEEQKPITRRRRLDFASTSKTGQKVNKATRSLNKDLPEHKDPVFAIKKEKYKPAEGAQHKQEANKDTRRVLANLTKSNIFALKKGKLKAADGALRRNQDEGIRNVRIDIDDKGPQQNEHICNQGIDKENEGPQQNEHICNRGIETVNEGPQQNEHICNRGIETVNEGPQQNEHICNRRIETENEDPQQIEQAAGDKENKDPQQNEHICNIRLEPENKDESRNEPEPGCSEDQKNNTVGEHITFNRTRLEKETIDLKNVSDYWDKYQQENSLPIDVLEEIDAHVGQTRLLLRSKFKQFEQLIQSASHDSNILPNDLDGFWDMICIQVDILKEKFAHLADLERNGFPEEVPVQITKVKRSAKKTKKNKIVAKSRFRQALAAKKAKEQQEMENPEPEITAMPKQTTPERVEVPTFSFTDKTPTTPLVHNNILAAQRSAKRSSSIGAIIRLSFYGKLQF